MLHVGRARFSVTALQRGDTETRQTCQCRHAGAAEIVRRGIQQYRRPDHAAVARMADSRTVLCYAIPILNKLEVNARKSVRNCCCDCVRPYH